MKILRNLIAATSAAFVLAVAVFAGDPTGAWKWTSEGRNGPMESTGTLTLKEGKLTGSVSGRNGDTAIGDATFKNDQIDFTVTREFNGNKMVSKFSGKLEGDTITGSIERPGRDGKVNKSVWKATRSK
jgi:hypothetical protein